MSHLLRLIEDELSRDAAHPESLPPLDRVLYVARGELEVRPGGEGPVRLGENAGRHCAGSLTVRAGRAGARVLRFELLRLPSPPTGGGLVLLEHSIALDEQAKYLMRCDRVDFDPGGVALPHRHRGGGIRCLLKGELKVTVGEAPGRVIRPGEAWFESGREPVLAEASTAEETSFVRVSILPLEIQGQSSIMYVKPEDARRGRPRRYTVLVDEPIVI
jgi:quercetin dioxygenase-like cupin family protein